MLQPFVSSYRIFRKRRVLFLVLAILLFLSAGYFTSLIRLEEDIFKMVMQDDAGHYNEALKNTKLLDYLVIRIGTGDTTGEYTGLIIQYADQLNQLLTERYDSNHIRKIRYRFESRAMQESFGEFYDNLPVFLEENDYIWLDSLLNRESIRTTVAGNYRLLVSPASMAMKRYLVQDPLSIAPRIMEKLKAFQPDDNFIIHQGCIFTRDLSNLLMIVSPANPSSETGKNASLVQGIKALTDSLNSAYSPAVNAEYFGGAAVSVANASRVKKDIILTVGIAMVVVISLMVLYFRQKRIIFILVIPAVFGGSMALALLYFIQGTISGIALGVGSVLVGIAIDYSLHFFSHFQSVGSVEKTLKDITAPILLSCLTTAAAFLCLGFVSSAALRDMGWFAALSIIFAAVFALLILPHLVKDNPGKSKLSFINRITSYDYHRNRYLKWSIVIITIFSLFFFRHVTFEEDLEKMSYMTPELERAEQNLNKISTVSLRTMYVVSVGENISEALQNNESLDEILNELKKSGKVQNYLLPSELYPAPSAIEESIKRWDTFWDTRRDSVSIWLDEAGKEYGFRPGAFDGFNNLIRKDFSTQEKWDFPVLKEKFLEDYINETGDAAYIVTSIRLGLENKQYVHAALKDVPGQVIIDRQFLATRFVNMLREDFSILVLVSMLIVFLIILISFGRIELTVVTYVPMLVSWVWTLGIMSILGIEFTIFNVVITTFIFGLGIDYSIFITRGLLDEFKTGERNLNSFKTSIFLSAITTISGVGVLIFASHPALKSIAVVSVVGILSVVFIAYTLQPILFYWLIRTKGRKRFAPITFVDFFFSLVALVIFVSGTVILTVLGGIMFYLTPFSRRRLRYVYHYLIMMAFRVVIYAPFNISKKVIGFNRKKFRKPALIIGNHQSHIDILLILMLYPKILVLTNEKVHRRIYGALAGMADFYPVTSAGIDDSLPRIAKRVKEGYSILIFPEGTRSDDTTIHRFHRGAFYLAEQLQLDVLPVIFHGVGDVLKKGELFLRSGKITMKILSRIAIDDDRFGKDYRERTKGFRKFIIREYQLLEQEYGQAEYFHRRMVMNYVYRGAILEWYLKVKMRMEDHYRIYDEYVPKEGIITDLGCGYGFISYLLNFRSPHREILGIDHDPNKILVAENAYYKNPGLGFIQGDVRYTVFPESDAFILSDVLHYFPEKDQENLIENCASKLKEGGVILIREGDQGMQRKHKGTVLSEFFSTKILHFNKTSDAGMLHFTSGEKIRQYALMAGLEFSSIDKTRYTSNILYVLKKANIKPIRGSHGL